MRFCLIVEQLEEKMHTITQLLYPLPMLVKVENTTPGLPCRFTLFHTLKDLHLLLPRPNASPF